MKALKGLPWSAPPRLSSFQTILHAVFTVSGGITVPFEEVGGEHSYETIFFFLFCFQSGLIRTDNGEFFIEPLEKGQQDVEMKGRVHVVYRRVAIKKETGQERQDLHNEGGSEAR